jgi:hypothetical protein
VNSSTRVVVFIYLRFINCIASNEVAVLNGELGKILMEEFWAYFKEQFQHLFGRTGEKHDIREGYHLFTENLGRDLQTQYRCANNSTAVIRAVNVDKAWSLLSVLYGDCSQLQAPAAFLSKKEWPVHFG